MKNVNNTLKWSLFLALFGFLVSACQKDATLDFEKNVQESIEMDFAQTSSTADDVQARNPPTNPNPALFCYAASVKVDYNCDGSFELGVNDNEFSYATCLERVQQIIVYYQGLGYCAQREERTCRRTDCRFLPVGQ
ncbi:MAG: hypothetical protein AAFV95_08800 [Bacteroidota bacterium]